jgi:hypothetical protein
MQSINYVIIGAGKLGQHDLDLCERDWGYDTHNSAINLCYGAECRQAECCYAECSLCCVLLCGVSLNSVESHRAKCHHAISKLFVIMLLIGLVSL